MKKILSKIVAVFATALLVLSGVSSVAPLKAYADETYHKVTGLRWEDDTYKAHWDAYDSSEKNSYYVVLYHGTSAIPGPNGTQKPGFVSNVTEYDFRELIEANGPGEYSFKVGVAKDSSTELQYTMSEMSSIKNAEGASYDLTITLEPSTPCSVYVNNTNCSNLTMKAYEYQGMELKAEPTANYRFTGFTSMTDGVDVSSGRFIMPAKNVEIKASFEPYTYLPHPVWDENSFTARWDRYEGCKGYSVVLYDDGGFEPQIIMQDNVYSDNTLSYDFSDRVAAEGIGIYSFSVYAYFKDGTNTDPIESARKEYGYTRISNLDFTVDTSKVTKVTEGNTVNDVLSELSSLNSEEKLLTGLTTGVKQDTTFDVGFTDDTTSIYDSLDLATVIEKGKTYYIRFDLVTKDSTYKFTDTVTGPSGVTLLRNGLRQYYAFVPVVAGSASGGTTPDPDPTTPDPTTPEPTPGPVPGPAPAPAPSTGSGSGNYLSSLDEKLDAAIASGSSETITWSAGDSLPLEVMKKIKDSDVTLEFTYTYEGKEYTVLIDKTNVPDEEAEWYGPAYLAGKLGSVETKTASTGYIASNAPANMSSVIDLNSRVYLIIRGDTLSKIAKKLGTTVKTLLAMNTYVTDPNLIYAGKTLLY